MPMKRIHVGFDISPEMFMKMLQFGSSSMKIEVLGTDDNPRRAQAPKLLPAPDRTGARKIVLDYLVANKRAVEVKELREVCMKAGYADTTASNQVHILKKMRLVKRVRGGAYVATDKAVQHG